MAGKRRNYDQTKRRRKVTKRKGYMESARDRGGAKRKAIEIGPATVDRIVRGRYEWRDGAGGLRKRKRGEDEDSGTQTRQRPHDPG